MPAMRCFAIAVLVLGLVPAAALGATVEEDAGTGIITIVGDASVDDITVSQTLSAHVVSIPAGSLTTNTCTGNGMPVVQCPMGTSIAVDLADGNDRFTTVGVTVPISVAGGLGNDSLSGGAANDVLAGGPGNDILKGGAGIDDYFGETGDDVIEARDRLAERISCGAGNDQAANDFIDIIAECERGVDGDHDGFSTAVDCNDAAANIFPGAREIFDNGIDENCDGRDNTNLDRDGDGFPRPIDCDDSNPRIRPNTPEIRGNSVDENCDRRAEPFAQLAAVVSNRWTVSRRFTRLRTLIVHNAPKGAKVVLRCKGRGCPIKRARRRTVRRELARVVMHRGFARARLRRGVRVQLTITAAQTIGRTYTYTVQRGALPSYRTVCRAPGQKKGRAC